MDRRGFLKFFGAGAAIAPVIAGIPDIDKQALIIEPPKVIIPEPPKVEVFRGFNQGESDCTVFIRDRKTSRVTKIEATGFVANFNVAPIEVTSYLSEFQEFATGRMDITFKVTGYATHVTSHS